MPMISVDGIKEYFGCYKCRLRDCNNCLSATMLNSVTSAQNDSGSFSDGDFLGGWQGCKIARALSQSPHG